MQLHHLKRLHERRCCAGLQCLYGPLMRFPQSFKSVKLVHRSTSSVNACTRWSLVRHALQSRFASAYTRSLYLTVFMKAVVYTMKAAPPSHRGPVREVSREERLLA